MKNDNCKYRTGDGKCKLSRSWMANYANTPSQQQWYVLDNCVSILPENCPDLPTRCLCHNKAADYCKLHNKKVLQC